MKTICLLLSLLVAVASAETIRQQGVSSGGPLSVTSLTVPGGAVLVSSGARVSALGVGTDIPASGEAFGGDLTFTGAGPQIFTNSSDGGDNRYIQFGAGGAAGNTRGGYINLGGNEATSVSLGGKVQLIAGNVPTGTINLTVGNGNEVFRADNDGHLTGFGSLTMAGSSATINAGSNLLQGLLIKGTNNPMVGWLTDSGNNNSPVFRMAGGVLKLTHYTGIDGSPSFYQDDLWISTGAYTVKIPESHEAAATFASSITILGTGVNSGFVIPGQATLYSDGTRGILGNGSQDLVYLPAGKFQVRYPLQADDSLTVAGSTFTVANSGIVSAPSQPGIRVYRNTSQNIPDSTRTSIYFSTVRFNNQIGWDVANSSDTFTIPTGGGGHYSYNCGGSFTAGAAAAGTRQVELWLNGALIDVQSQVGAAIAQAIHVIGEYDFAAGDTIQCKIWQTSGGTITFGDGGIYNYGVLQKLW